VSAGKSTNDDHHLRRSYFGPTLVLLGFSIVPTSFILLNMTCLLLLSLLATSIVEVAATSLPTHYMASEIYSA